MKRTAPALSFAIALVSASIAMAQETATLTVSAGGTDRSFTIDEMRALEAASITTTTPWTDGPQTFVGVTGPRFVEAAGIAAPTVSAVALNDYKVEIPIETLNDPNLLIAYERNGSAMSVRDKGPFWIVFPYDEMPDYLGDAYISYSIWNLSRLEEIE